jgi:hypothetical protein
MNKFCHNCDESPFSYEGFNELSGQSGRYVEMQLNVSDDSFLKTNQFR